MGGVPDFAAVLTYSCVEGNCSEDGVLLEKGWQVSGSLHPHFDVERGGYIAPKDGLYSVYVLVDSKNAPPDEEGVRKSRKRRRSPREHVRYCVRLSEPTFEDDAESDVISEEFLDVGDQSFGEVLHLRAGTKVCVIALPRAKNETLTFKVELVQRKRKPPPEPELTEKEKKKLAKKKRKLERQAHDVNGETCVSASVPHREYADDNPKGALQSPKKPSPDGASDENDEHGEDGNWSAEFTSDDSEQEN